MPVKETSRPRCKACRRPLSHCLCAHISVVHNRTQVLILQHSDESRHPLNTARLAMLGLQNAELLVGEAFPDLDERLALAGDAVLLFPADNERADRATENVPEAEGGLRPALDSPGHAAPLRATKAGLLIVPDGTWRKARQIVRANAALHNLPRLHLHGTAPSQYIVRKAREPHALSTIEAIVHALSILEPEQDFRPLLKPFHVMVEHQIDAMGPEVFQRNYMDK